LDLIVLASGFVSDISIVKCEKEALKGKVINFTKEFIFILKAVTIRFDQDEEDLLERHLLFPRNGNIILKPLSG